MHQHERKYSYFEVVGELVQNRVIEPKDAYIYLIDKSLSFNLKVTFDMLFQFCQENLSRVCVEEGFNIEPSRFLYTDCLAVNACASFDPESGFYTIDINRGTIVKLYGLFCRKNLLNELPEYRALNEFLEEPPRNISLSYLMMQMATIFTYYHELGHLIQYTNLYGKGVSMSMAENYLYDPDAPFDIHDHMDEFDADLHGAHFIAGHAYDYWCKLPEEQKNSEYMKKLITVSLVGVLGYIMLLWEGSDGDLYYFDSSYNHPHPTIRIQWILVAALGTLDAKFPTLNHKEIVDQVFKILDVYCVYNGKRTTKERLRDPLFREYDGIMTYMHEMIRTSEEPDFSYLAKRTIHLRDIMPDE